MNLEWLSKIAPTVATALGGPLAGVAVSALGKALGVDEVTTEKVTGLLQSGNMTGEQIAAIRMAEIELKKQEQENGFKFAELDIKDRDSARQREIAVKDNVPGRLAVFVTVGFFSVLAYLLVNGTPPQGGEALLVMLGALGAAWGAVVNYYYGSSKGSSAKDATIQSLAK